MSENIESILKPLFKAINKLDAYCENKDTEQHRLTAVIDKAERARDEAKSETTKSNKIAMSLRKMLDTVEMAE